MKRCMEHIYDGKWEYLKSELHYKDTIVITNIEKFAGDDYEDMIARLQCCAQMQISLYDGKHKVDTKLLSELLDIALELKKNKIKALQKKGIDEALYKKKYGRGKYGRPSICVPRDFKEKVLCYLREKQPLEPYRKEIGMKKSTFYKYANKVKNNEL